MKSSFIHKILGRPLENLDSSNLNILIQRLAKERALFETIFNILQEGLMVIDSSGVIEYANQSVFNLLGIKEQDLGKALLWQYVPDFYTMFSKDFQNVSVPPTVTREIEVNYPEKRFLRVYIVSFISSDRLDKEKRLFALIFHDITQDKLSHEAYLENEKISSIFMLAASVAHELGNPLNSIHIQLQLIERFFEHTKAQNLEKIKKSVSICIEEVERLHNIIKHFLEAIRPSIPEKKPIFILNIIQEVLNFTKPELDNLNIIIDIDPKVENPLIMGDKDQLKQVFYNLIRNASEAMDIGGKITINTRIDENYLYIYIADTGKGIHTDDINKLFQPYASTKKGGHGLGMMIVQRIIREHGGYVGINSQEDLGTIITLQLPLGEKRLKTLPEIRE